MVDGVAQRRWTADELAVALDRSLSCAEAGARLGRIRLQVEKVRKRYRGRDIEQLLAQKCGRAVELARVAETDIACYGSWTPQEIAVALDRSISRAEAARRLGRSFRAIKRMRDLQRQKAFGLVSGVRESQAERIQQRLWTEDEIAVLTDESRTPTEIATELGRSINSVTVARARWLGRLQGRVPNHLHGTNTGVSRYGCLCPQCRDAAEAERERRQETTRHTAVNYKAPWTDCDIEIALDRNLTVIEAAQRLGRTHSAVRALRYKYREA
ncbi:hypothetical protein [Mycobacteroides abscessus]|uniref:hypothetical protein n=1 Tax=Mycobacteroides abscessus TaxID=36809 RepID=UPI00089DB2CA|nr:hypothetical protein [Mycobacteroides abscessus]TPF68331.1 hypothetical protein XW60_05665 [Mycobacteroides abscessus subsp. bolletii]BBB42793.1 hypothetical protein MASB_33590 [Mycobacteroides abscessus subsp. bolletii BD]